MISHSLTMCPIFGSELTFISFTQTLSSVFALSTHRIKFRSDEPTSSANLLRAFSLPSSSPSNNEFLVHSPKRRSVSGTSLFIGKPKHSYKQSRPTTFTRSASSTSALVNQPTPPSRSGQDERKSDANKAIALPEALVISGLEDATVTTQRTFLQVLIEKRITLESEVGDVPDSRGQEDTNTHENGSPSNGGVWNLPKDFFVVYVCNFDPQERPKIHRTLV
jgi:hypothetical protein